MNVKRHAKGGQGVVVAYTAGALKAACISGSGCVNANIGCNKVQVACVQNVGLL